MQLDRPPHEIDAWLEPYRVQIDEVAAAAAAEVMSSASRHGGDLIDAVEACARAGAPASVRLLDEASSIPPWVDFAAMECGARMGLRHPIQSGLALVMGSLIESYGSGRGVKVLIRAGRLESQVIARLRDTTGFVLQVAASRGPRPGSATHRHILRTRMVHAFVRHGILKRGDWNSEWGQPINQEDYASTLLAFTHVYLRCLRTLGVEATDEEEESAQHLYRWVGFVMGVAPDLLTANRADERALYHHIRRRQLNPDDDSRVLAHGLVDALAGRPPFFLPPHALMAWSRLLVGDELADGLGFSRSTRWTRVGRIVPLVSTVQRAAERLPGALPRMEAMGEQVARLVFRYGLAS